MGGLLATLAQDSATLVAGGARARLNNLWTSQVLPFCREAIGDRYPFERGSRRETTLHDFGRLFGPGGLLDAFFSEHLSPLADTSRRTWRWVEGGIGIPDSVLVQFQRAATIREAFFAGRWQAPRRQLRADPDQHGRQRRPSSPWTSAARSSTTATVRSSPRAMKWPAPEGLGRVRIVFTGVDGKTPRSTEEGAWAWFRVLDRARLQPTGQPELFRVTFSLGGFSAGVELRAPSVRNAFQFGELRGFTCPERL